MTRPMTCPACTSPVPPGAAFCPACGRPAPGTLVIEPLDDIGSRDREIVIGAKNRRRSPLALAAAVAVLVAGVLVVSRDNDGGPSTAPTTTIAATTTTAPDTTTTVRAASTTTVQLVQRVAPALSLGQQTGLVVYLAVPRQDVQILYAVDLDQGVFREVGSMVYTDDELPILGDAIVVSTDTAEFLVHPDGATKLLGDPPEAAFTAGRSDAYWKVEFTDRQAPSVAILVVIGAPEQRSVSIPAGFTPLAGDGVGGLLVRGPDERTYRLAPDADTLVVLDTSSPLDAVNGRMAALRCDETLKCRIEVVDLTTGARRAIPASKAEDGPASLAPDGAHLAQIITSPDGNRETLLVFDTATGDTLLRAPYEGLSYQSGPPRWSPDGRWLFWNDVRGLEAWNIDRIQPLTVDLPMTDRVSMHVVGVAAKP